jgi:pantoate--beta-alanine ligase
MRVVTTFAEARRYRRGVVGLVPTMGYLHEGHLSLIERAAAECDTVIVTSFVNPLQFDDPSDLERYPADLERDIPLAAGAGGAVLFAPPRDEMYPDDQLTRVVVRRISDVLEGEWRPGHLEGVATVVTKLLAGLRPDRAYFGRKDAQQLAMVRRMARDLSVPVEVIGCPTVRERSGLALSSRNPKLGDEDREAALGLSRGLMEAAGAVDAGERSGEVLAGLVTAAMAEEPRVSPEYAALASQDDVTPLAELDRPAFLAVAARVGGVRLIDNIHIDHLVDDRAWGGATGDFVVDRGVRLAGESVLYGGGD